MLGILKKRTAQGIFWVTCSQGANFILKFVSIAILARLLAPRQFGIVAMAAIFTELVMVVRDLGFGTALIQKPDLDQSHLSTAFWGNIVATILLWLALALASPAIAIFFRNDLVGPVIIVSSLGFLLNALGMVHMSMLSKQLDFKKLAIVEVVSSLAYGTAAVLLALNGFGVWSIVFGGLLQRLVSTLLLWEAYRWRPSFIFSINAFKKLFGFGANVVGANLTNYAGANVDYMLVGRLLDASALGIYTMAYRLMTLALSRVSVIFTRVMFPAFSTVQDDNARLRRIYVDLVRYLATITFPLTMGLMVLAPEFIRAVYGSKWTGAIVPLQIMCVAGILKSIGTTVGSVQYAKGRPDIGFKWSLFTLLVLSGAVGIGISYGIAGVALAVTIATILLFPIIQVITNSLIDLRFRNYLFALYPPALGALGMAGALLLFRRYTVSAWGSNDLSFLLSSIPVGAGVYLAFIFIIQKQLLSEIKQIIEAGFTQNAAEEEVPI